MAGKYVAYSEYKDSGVEWLGEIPKHWECIKLKYVADLEGDKVEAGSQQKYVGMENVQPGNGKYFATEEVRPEGLSTSFCTGDVLFGKLRPYLAKSWLADFSGICSSEFLVLRSRGVSPRFLNYYTLTEEFINQVDSSTYGSKMPRASWDFISLMGTPVPPSGLSENIANFLDHETAKIDTLIEEQKTLIRLLQEKRQAVISHAVTKGLNPDAPMKDSGVEWLGEVPEHWEVIKLKHLIEKMDQGWSPQCDSRPAESHEYGVLKVGCVNGGFFTPNENKALPPELPPRFEYLLQKGQLLISRANTKELVGSAAVVDREYPNLLLCDKLYRLTLTTGISIEFIKLLLGASVYRKQIELGATGASSSMQNIAQDIIKELSIALPENEEVDEILCYVDLSITKYDQLIKEAGSAISYMQERRTALISAAVTGKIDVRDWAAPKPIVARQQEQQTTEAVE